MLYILGAWFVRHGHYLELTKTFVLGIIFISVLAHEQAITVIDPALLGFIFQIIPMFLKLMIDFVTTRVEDEPSWRGYVYMICIIILNFAKSLTRQWYFYLVSTVGLRIRTALNCAIYSKALIICPTAKSIKGHFFNTTYFAKA